MAFTKATGDYIDQATLTEISAGIDWQTTPKTSAFTAVSGEGYLVDTTSAAITVTLPTSPTAGDEIVIIDYASNAETNNITLDPGTLNFRGATDDFVISANNQSAHLLYSGATKGWLVITEASGDAAAPAPDLDVSYLVVAGGGGGGVCVGGTATGGGGGAGGLRNSYDTTGGGAATESTLTLYTDTNYAVTIGAGGAGKSGENLAGSKGSDSTFSTITSEGGGGGGGNSISPSSGGSGGGGQESDGAGASGVSGQGYAGGNGTESGNRGGGGGGAGSAGSGGTGGSSISTQITGSSESYAGGGTAPINGGSNPSGHAADNSGNGGISGGSASQNGGSGIVILRYPDYYNVTLGAGLTGSGVNTSIPNSTLKYTKIISGNGNITFGAA